MITELINKIGTNIVIGITILALCTTACSDNDNWTPGPLSTNTTEVYFADKGNTTLELDRDEAGEFNIYLCRTDSANELTVPVTISTNSKNFNVPSSVTFPDGKDTVKITLKYNGGDATGNYSCNLSISDPNYINQYSTRIIELNLNVYVTNWTLVTDSVQVTPSYKTIPNYICQLYHNEGTTQYKLKNFMVDYDLVFNTKTVEEVQPTKDIGDVLYIYPTNGLYEKEAYGDDACWLKKDGNDFAIYAHDVSGYYFYYTFLYVGGNYSWGTSFINIEKKYGSIGIFMTKWSLDTNERVTRNDYDYLNFSWK